MPHVLDGISFARHCGAIAGESDPERVPLLVLRAAIALSGAESGLLVQDGERGPSVIPGSGGGAATVALDGDERCAPEIVRHVLRTRDAVLLDDATGEGEFVDTAYVRAARPRSVLCVPLLSAGRTRTVVYLEHRHEVGCFTAVLAEAIRLLAEFAATTLEKVRTQRGLESLATTLELEVLARTRRLAEAEARLVQLEKENLETHAAEGFAHEMRSALASASFHLAKALGLGSGEPASLAEQSLDLLVEAEQQAEALADGANKSAILERLQQIAAHQTTLVRTVKGTSAAVERALSITDLILEYSRVGKAVRGTKRVDLSALVGQVLGELREETVALRITVSGERPSGSWISGTEDQLLMIVRHLVRNACEAIAEEGDQRDRTLEVGVETRGLALILRVADSGCGMDARTRDRMFEPFFTTHPRTGTGLGLGMVRKLVGLYDGRIDVESEPGHGTTVSVTFPEPLAGATGEIFLSAV